MKKKLPERPAERCGKDWWQSLSHEEKKDEVRPLVNDYHLATPDIQRYLGLKSYHAVASILFYLDKEARGQSGTGPGADFPPRTRRNTKTPAAITLAGPPLKKSSSGDLSPFPAASDDLPRSYIDAICSLYG